MKEKVGAARGRKVMRVNVIDESCFVAQDKLDINREERLRRKRNLNSLAGLKFG